MLRFSGTQTAPRAVKSLHARSLRSFFSPRRRARTTARTPMYIATYKAMYVVVYAVSER